MKVIDATNINKYLKKKIERKRKKTLRRMHKKDTTESKFNNKKISKVTHDSFVQKKLFKLINPKMTGIFYSQSHS